MSRVEIYLTEREDEDGENTIIKKNFLQQDYLPLEFVLNSFTEALKGFGFLSDNQFLDVVREDEQ